MASTAYQVRVSSEPVAPLVDRKQSRPAKRSYAQILKSSALVGGAQRFNVSIAIVRTKGMAMLLGPEELGRQFLATAVEPSCPSYFDHASRQD